MKYYLSHNPRAKFIEELIWNRNGFENYEKANDLENIVSNFCLQFDTEENIKAHVMKIALEDYLAENIDEMPDVRKALCIKYKYKDEVKVLPDIPVKKDRKYFDVEMTVDNYYDILPVGYLQFYILAERSDNKFLKLLLKQYGRNPKHNKNMHKIQNHIVFSEMDKFYISDAELMYIIKSFLRRELCKFNRKIDRYEMDEYGNYVIQYRKLYDLAMLVKNYQETKEAEKVKKLAPTQMSMFT